MKNIFIALAMMVSYTTFAQVEICPVPDIPTGLIQRPVELSAVPVLNSFPSAQQVVFFDFDGHIVVDPSWNSGDPIDCAPSGLSEAGIREAFNRASEDYRPFDINLTTDSLVYLATPEHLRIRMIVTPTNYFFMGAGGGAWVGSFGTGTPGFIFTNMLQYNGKYVGECMSHETGHTRGLIHQGKWSTNCTLTTQYDPGAGGSQQISFAPLMGSSYTVNTSGWRIGTTPYGCTNLQDDVAVMISRGLQLRQDEDTVQLTTVFNKTAVISHNDTDVYRLHVLTQGLLFLTIKPYSVFNTNIGSNLHAQAILNGVVYYNPTALDITVSQTLDPGIHYLKITGAGNAYMTSYSSMGQYTIDGNFSTVLSLPENPVPQIPGVVIPQRIFNVYDFSGRLIMKDKYPTKKGFYIIRSEGRSRMLVI